MDGRRGLMMARRSSTQVANVGDIAYKASDGSIKVISQNAWDASLGIALGVVVIPSGFAPDNKLPRIAALVEYSVKWSTSQKDTSLKNYLVLATTDNTSLGATGTTSRGYLPSDGLSGATSFVDPIAKYGNYTPYIPSPYLGDTPNPAYYAEMANGNALSDFNGKGNTDVLVALGSAYTAANSARGHKVTGAEEIVWSLPAAGELGHLVPRRTVINASLTKAGGTLLSVPCWSSTEYSSDYAYGLGIINCNEWEFVKTRTDFVVRPFTTLESFTRGKAACQIKYELELGYTDSTGNWYAYAINSKYPVASDVTFAFNYIDRSGVTHSISATIARGKDYTSVAIPSGSTVIGISGITPSEDLEYSYVYGEW